MGHPHDGILLIDKNENETSFDVVRKVKKVLRINKIGHAGTLDPFATGLLIILLGQGTKLSPYLLEAKKVYEARMRLGIETDTQDLTGRVMRTVPVPEFDCEYIKKQAQGFIGEMEQTPPAFSAVKYRGRRSYWFARKGIRVELPKRKVTFYSIKVTTMEPPDITIEVICSSGTYIRRLASDFGEKLGPGAHLRALRRLAIGSFKLKGAIDSGHIGLIPLGDLCQMIIPLRHSLPDMSEVEIDAKLAQKIRNGYQPGWEDGILPPPFEGHHDKKFKLRSMSELVAIVNLQKTPLKPEGDIRLMRVFH
ncbi:MAG: tRNA pseudouridine(55) synthase TruB [Pseudomonadota bacterium]